MGRSQLGYGDGDENTVVLYGPSSSNKYITTYFRHTFAVADPSVLGSLTLQLLRDDGAVVYINGVEVFRSNMPSGTVTYTTPASAAVGSADEQRFFPATVDASVLVPGPNVIAVEIHQSSGTSSDVSFDLELTTNTGLSLLRGPYLQLGTPTSTVVRWRTDTAADSVVRYGTAPASLTSTANVTGTRTEHEVTLTGLSPATRYYYAVGSSTTTLAGDATFTFKTSPVPGTDSPTRVWVLGDSGRANTDAAVVRDAYRTFTAGRDTDLWLMLGDNAYVDGTNLEYQRAVFEMYPEELRQVVLWPTLGNHDGHTADSATQTGGYYDIFTLPRAAEAGGTASGTEAYYSFDYGNIHFVCLESFETDRSPSAALASWLQTDLAATTARWVVAYWHHPPYSKGSHDSDSEIELVQMRQYLLPVLEAGGVDLVLSGHSHAYERSMLLDGHYGLSTTLTGAMTLDTGSGREANGTPYLKVGSAPVPHQGTVYVVAGTSAQASGGSLNHPAMFVSMSVLGSLVLDVDGARLDASFVDATGTVRDQFTILKDTAATQPPAAPQALTATATVPTAVNLGWTDASADETGFRLERSLDGTTFAEIAVVGPNVTTYGDGSASPATTY